MHRPKKTGEPLELDQSEADHEGKHKDDQRKLCFCVTQEKQEGEHVQPLSIMSQICQPTARDKQPAIKFFKSCIMDQRLIWALSIPELVISFLPIAFCLAIMKCLVASP